TMITYKINFTLVVIPSNPSTGSQVNSGPETPSAKEKQIVKELNVTNGNAVVVVDQGVTEVLVPLQDKAIHDIGKLIFQRDDLSLEIPSGLIAEWAALLNDSNTAYLSFKFKKVEKPEVEKLLNHATNEAHAKITLAGEVFELSLQVSNRDGTKAKTISSFSQPLTLRLKVGQSANKEMTGIYFIQDNGGLEYVGGHRLDGVIEAPIYHFSQYGVLTYDKTFNDVPSSHWASQVIKRMAAQGIVSGVSDAEFAPQNKVTRAEFVTMLARALGLKPTGTTTF
ncbi:S-layer homology domain-containing protein, partial [Paenibacillus sp. TAF58]